MKQIARVELNLAKTTFGTYLYATYDPSVEVRNVYVKKSAFSGVEPPSKITVVIESE